MFLDDAASVSAAASALGWPGSPVPVRVAGEDAWAIAALGDQSEAPGSERVVISGVLVAGAATNKTTDRASVFAGYCPRAVLVPDSTGVMPVVMAAAVLDQGVVVAGNDRMTKLSDAGPAVNVAGDGDHAALARRILDDQIYPFLAS